jgi:hypothetical protein
MKPFFQRFFLTGMIILSLAACNFPSQAPTPTNTAMPPTQTPEPSPTPIPPTETPTSAPTPSWTVPPPPVFPTATSTTAATEAAKPVPNARFEGVFEGGTLVFRTNDKGTMVIPKEIKVRKASCNEGKTISTLLAFDPPPFFPITDGQFTISREEQIEIFGIFISSMQARGSIELYLLRNGKPCTVGPVTWVASAVP